jgi:hypothetical protein
MKSAKRLQGLRSALGRARMALGGCRELRRARDELTVFRRDGEAPPGPGFGSWL